LAEEGEQRFAENPSEIPVSSVGWWKPILAGFLSFLITGLGQAYNRQWRRTLGFVMVTLLLDFVFLRFHVWATFKGLAVGLSALLVWRTVMSADAAVQARRRLKAPTKSLPGAAASLGAVAIVVAAVLLGSTNCFNPLAAFRDFRITSSSMCPTLCEGDRIIADVAGFRAREPQRGDVAMFLFDRESALHVKRIVAAGGDEVVNTQTDLLVNGSPVRLPTSACGTSAFRTPPEAQPSENLKKLQVPAKQFLVVGDDLGNSYDSRFYGAIDVSRLRGKPIYLYWSRRTDRIGCVVK
jgi:signal peptidase I